MKIRRYFMEDWLNDSRDIPYNLSASGVQDYILSDFLAVCEVDLQSFGQIFLGDNDTRGSLRLRQEICRSYTHLPPDKVLVTNGTSEALFTFFNEVLDAGDEVVMPFPAFQCLYEIPASIGCRIRFLNLLTCRNWKLDIDKLAELVTSDTKLIIINTPHNPFGWTLSAEEIRQIGEIANKAGSYLLFDEHYRYLPLTDGCSVLPSGYDICHPLHPQTYATGSMIKCFGIVGIRIGWLVGDPAMLARCRDYKDYLTHTIPEITDYLAFLSLHYQERIIHDRKKHILPNLRLLNEFMAHHAAVFEYQPPTGGVVCFPRLRQGDATQFCRTVLQQHGVSLLPGASFETPDHFRLNFGTETTLFQQALERIDDYLAA